MSGFDNDIMFAKNADFTSADNQAVSESNGLVIDGKMWIGSTALNAGLTHINVGSITSPLGTITIGYSTPNITMDLTGGGVAVEHLTGNTGGPLNPDGSNNFNILGSTVVAGTTPHTIAGSGSTLTSKIQISQALAATDATKVGLANFDSASFAVDANGFVTFVGGITWTDVSGAFSPLKNNGYFITGTATGTLPAAPAQGDTIKFIVDHASQLLTIQATAGKFIRLGNTITAAAGTAVSTLQGDSIELVYRTSDLTWQTLASVGQWNLT